MVGIVGPLAACVLLLASMDANAACSARNLSTERLGNFLNNPSGLLDQFPSGTEMMSFQVTELASASATTLNPLRSIIQNTNASQREAIGDGLARAYRACRTRATDQARAIKEFALKNGSSDVALSFVRHSEGFDEETNGLKPRTYDADLFRNQWNRTSGSSDEKLSRSSTYLSGTGGIDLDPKSKNMRMRNPFAPVEILKR